VEVEGKESPERKTDWRRGRGECRLLLGFYCSPLPILQEVFLFGLPLVAIT